MSNTINIIGCGRAAGTLGRLWLEAGAVTVGQVVNRSLSSSKAAVSKLGVGTAVGGISALEPADIWLIGTSDAQIPQVAESLAASGIELGEALVFHLAGRFGLEVLQPLNDGLVRLAALHPVRSLSGARLSLEAFSGTACVAEGEQAALERLKPLVTSIGGTWLPVDSVDRGLYHASVSVISNITKAVAWKAQKWQTRAGLPAETAAEVTHQLLQSTMEDLFLSGARQTITGPVVRGDTSTVEAHLEAIRATHPEDVEIYRVLGQAVLDLAQERGDLDEATRRRFKALLGG